MLLGIASAILIRDKRTISTRTLTTLSYKLMSVNDAGCFALRGAEPMKWDLGRSPGRPRSVTTAGEFFNDNLRSKFHFKRGR